MKPAETDVIIELHVPDFGKAKKFYSKLGFKVVWERKPEGPKGYLVLKGERAYSVFGPALRKCGITHILKNSRKLQNEAMLSKS